MNQAQYNQKQLDKAWKQVEGHIKASGMVTPAPGFTARWNQRLLLEKQRQDRRQAWTLVVINVAISLGFLGLISIQIAPSLAEGASLLDIWVDLASRVIVTLKMVGGLASTIGRTLPGLLPTSWWMSGITGLGILLTLWVSMVRTHLRQQGAAYEKA